LASLESSKVPLPERLKNGKVRRKRKTKTASAKTVKTAKRSKAAVAAE